MARKRKLLIAGGGYADIPMIEAGKALGFHVITSGNRAEDMGHRYSDECRLEDFSDPQAMLKLAKELEVDAICPCCNDFSALSAAFVAETLGLPGHDSFATAQVIHHKDRYREFAQEHAIPTPRAEGFSSLEEASKAIDRFSFPVIVKPVDLTGGKGISVARQAKDLPDALTLAFSRSRAKRIVIEEFIEGTRHGMSAFLRDGKVVFQFTDNEQYYLNPYLVSAASTPGNVPPSAIEKLCHWSERIADILSLKTGIFHIQFILSNGEPIIIEICRRPPGDLYTRFVAIATGIDYPSHIVQAFCGMDCKDLFQKPPIGFFARHCVMTYRNGRVRDVVFDPSVRDKVIDQFLWWKPNDLIEDFLTQKNGIVFLKFDSRAQMDKLMPSMQTLIRTEFMDAC